MSLNLPKIVIDGSWNFWDIFNSNQCMMAFQKYPQIFFGRIQTIKNVSTAAALLEKDCSFDIVQKSMPLEIYRKQSAFNTERNKISSERVRTEARSRADL